MITVTATAALPVILERALARTRNPGGRASRTLLETAIGGGLIRSRVDVSKHTASLGDPDFLLDAITVQTVGAFEAGGQSWRARTSSRTS
jgi:hypothetical protein